MNYRNCTEIVFFDQFFQAQNSNITKMVNLMLHLSSQVTIKPLMSNKRFNFKNHSKASLLDCINLLSDNISQTQF